MDTPSCLSNTFEMITGVLEAAISTTLLVMSFGTSATVTATAAATKTAMKAAAKKQAKRNAIMVSKEAFKRELKRTYKKIIKDSIKDTIKGKIEEKKTELMTNYALQGADGMHAAFEEKVKKEGDDPALILIKDVDPIGIVDAIDSSVSGDDSSNKQAAKWLTVFSAVDPTGVLGAVANFIKHDHCESTVATMVAKASENIAPPSLGALLSESCDDTPGWTNGHGAGYTCAYFANFYNNNYGYGRCDYQGSSINYPERNCCVCGKSR